MSANKNQTKKFKLGAGKTELFLLAVLTVLFIFFALTSPAFFQFTNIMNLLRQTSVAGIIALGMVFVIISGGIDLSVGSVLGFSGAITALLVTGTLPFLSLAPMAIPAAIAIAIIISAGVGLINGVLVYDGKVPPFIATMGMMALIRATLMLMTNARMISGLPESFLAIARFSPLGVPFLGIVWIVLTLIAFFIARKTVFGRNIYAYGSNPESARLSGINVRTTVYGTYVFSAVMCAIAGILTASRLSNAAPTAGTGFELDAIAASVVGGASLSGGQGSVIGVFLGAIIMQTLRQGGTLLGRNPHEMEIIIALLIIVAVLFDQQLRQKGGSK